MKNALKYGLIIGLLTGIWVLFLHVIGIYEKQYPQSDSWSWLEYVSVFIPFIGLYMGIKNFRNNYNGGKMEFFEGIFEGFRILVSGAIFAAFFVVVYIQFVNNELGTDIMGRVAAAGFIGVLFTLIISLLLMNKQRNL